MTIDLSTTARHILGDVLESLTQAEELGGPRGMDYIHLMEHVSKDAEQRALTYAKSIWKKAAPVMTQINENEDGNPIRPLITVCLDADQLATIAKELGISAEEVSEIFAQVNEVYANVEP